MKAWKESSALLVVWSCILVNGCAATTTGQTMDAAIQSIQQAPDPSAAVAAYANGFALDRNNPKLYAAFVTRMVDLGLPEMAYHQAEVLTTLQANNGLAWGVVAYVDARRAEMPEAISAINLAGQFAPDNQFVQHTAGELLAWYDLKADKPTVSDAAKDGLTSLRARLGQFPAYTEAYATAQQAYQTQTSTASPPSAPTQAAPVQVNPAPTSPVVPVAPQAQADQGVLPPGYGYAVTPPPPVYYQDYSPPYTYPDYSGAYLDWGPQYCYDWGPGWVAPAPWCWWQPCGFWGGCDFFPFGVSFAFGGFDDFHHFHHDGGFAHDGRTGQGTDAALWHGDRQGRNAFFGTPARPSASATQWARANSPTQTHSRSGAAGIGTAWWSGAGEHNSLATIAGSRSAQPSILARPSTSVGSIVPSARVGSLASTRGNLSLAPLTAARPSAIARSTSTAPAVRSSGSITYRAAPAPQSFSAGSYAVPRNSWVAPSYRAPTATYRAPISNYRAPAPSHRAPVNSAPRSFSGSMGGTRIGSSFSGAIRSGGSFGGRVGSSGGGFHGGGFSGGGHGGGRR